MSAIDIARLAELARKANGSHVMANHHAFLDAANPSAILALCEALGGGEGGAGEASRELGCRRC